MSDPELIFTTCLICQEKYELDAEIDEGSTNRCKAGNRSIYMRHPIQSFQCGHVLCAVCIASMHAAQVERNSESDDDWITCPFCNTPKSFHPIDQISCLLVKQYQEVKHYNNQQKWQRITATNFLSNTYMSSDMDTLPCRKLTVTGAGINAVNGDFVRSGFVDCVPRFDRIISLYGTAVTLSLYRCQLLDNSRKWFISIVSPGSVPGTNKDIDLYWAPYTPEDGSNVPPTGWKVVKDKGKLPVPTVVPCTAVAPTVVASSPCRRVTVSGAGINAINGEYIHSGFVDHAPRFDRILSLYGNDVKLSLYRCQLLDNSREWFISLVPPASVPGANKDVDLYWAPAEDGVNIPQTGWKVVKDKGKLPVPTIIPCREIQ